MLASVGIPPEGVGLLMAVDVVPDMIFTTLNATGYLAAAAVVGGRAPREKSGGAPGLENKVNGFHGSDGQVPDLLREKAALR
jgi:DAACS family dicarboxylate/amino acid:cation (Na+ or H+) symporter